MTEIDRICNALEKLKKTTRIIGEKEYLIEEIAKLSLEGDNSKWNYDNAVLIILDAVLTINRNYLIFVKPRVLRFRNEFSNIKTLDQMIELIDKIGDEKFGSDILRYKDLERVHLLKTVLNEFKQYLQEINSSNNLDGLDSIDNLEGLRIWAKSLNLQNLKKDRIFSIKGIGLSTIQYLRMLLGINTMMPDRHIESWIKEVLNLNKINVKDYINLLEQASLQMNISCIKIAEYIWALKNPKIPELEKPKR